MAWLPGGVKVWEFVYSRFWHNAQMWQTTLLDNLQMSARSGTSLPHQVLHTALRRRRSHTLAFCRSTQTVRPPHVHIVVWFTGVFFIELVVLECSSPAASWPSHLHQHLQTILENLSFQQQFWLTVCHCYSVHLLCFLRFCHCTRFHDSFCLASMFQMCVYLLTYLHWGWYTGLIFLWVLVPALQGCRV